MAAPRPVEPVPYVHPTYEVPSFSQREQARLEFLRWLVDTKQLIP